MRYLVCMALAALLMASGCKSKEESTKAVDKAEPAAVSKPAAETDAQAIQGEWHIVSAERLPVPTTSPWDDGHHVSPVLSLSLSNGTGTLMDKSGHSQTGTFTMDETTSPRQLSFTMPRSWSGNHQRLAIYELKNDELKICMFTIPVGERGYETGRPSHFQVSSDTVVYTFKRGSPTAEQMAAVKESKDRVQCAVNMRQIGQAIIIYCNEHKGKYPPSLGELFAQEEIARKASICPSSGISVPPHLNWSAVAEWINSHSSYIYMGAGMNQRMSPEMIAMYEKLDDHKDGCNVLFADGHVEWMSGNSAERVAHAQKSH